MLCLDVVRFDFAKFDLCLVAKKLTTNCCYLLQSLATKEEIEKLILQAGGVKSLIGLLHGISAIQKGKVIEKLMSTDKEVSRICPIPDGIPKTLEELDEEAEGKLPDSPYTRLLRARGKFPAWYSPAPDHETD